MTRISITGIIPDKLMSFWDKKSLKVLVSQLSRETILINYNEFLFGEDLRSVAFPDIGDCSIARYIDRKNKRRKKMATKLIKFKDGTLVEVEVSENQAKQIAGSFSDRVDGTFDKIKPILVRTCRPIMEAWEELNQEMILEQAEVEIGFSFEAEGNIYVTKLKASSNLTVKLILKPKV